MTKMENIVMNLTGCERQIANTVINTILEEDTKENTINESEWISVDERLPERQGYYLGCTYKGLMMIAPFFPVYAGDKPEFRYDITHWMPLPEAPKMKGGAE